MRQEQETSITIGVTEGTGDRPKKKKAKARAKATRKKHLPAGVDYAKLKPDALYGISRINQAHKSNVGWYLRIGPGESRINEWFSDARHGSTAKALKAAKARRDEIYNGLPDWYKLRGSKKRKVRG